VDTGARNLLLGDEISPHLRKGREPVCLTPHRQPPDTRSSSLTYMESGCWLVELPAVDGRQYVYRVYAPRDALLADLFWEAWHVHDEGPHPRAWDLFDAAVIRHVG
jgi:hypothetical protein